jgi:hypothetical protein
MAKAQSIIDSARYDLVDFVDGIGVGIEFDDAELLHYLNRMVGLMDSQLSALQSDLVEAEELNIDTVGDQSYVDISGLNSGLWTRIRSLWLGAVWLKQVSLDYMRYTRRFRSNSTGKPTIWCMYKNQILFPQDCPEAYTNLAIYYDAKSDDMALTDSMPYSDIFNEFFREMLVMNAKAKKEGIVDKADAMMNEMFRSRAMQEDIQRSFIPRTYNYTEF